MFFKTLSVQIYGTNQRKYFYPGSKRVNTIRLSIRLHWFLYIVFVISKMYLKIFFQHVENAIIQIPGQNKKNLFKKKSTQIRKWKFKVYADLS